MQRFRVQGSGCKVQGSRFEVQRGLRLKDSRSDQKRNFWELVPNSAVVGFRIS
ncbi:hypothetical protein D1AOALGA4SA_12487 [Olavius algarvensis Delta 1 endosymbiont]|nr:hypothetical protein D1AOALGA4SA_12487 [Olavius algarvensis Delta 1 endosymbiont]